MIRYGTGYGKGGMFEFWRWGPFRWRRKARW